MFFNSAKLCMHAHTLKIKMYAKRRDELNFFFFLDRKDKNEMKKILQNE